MHRIIVVNKYEWKSWQGKKFYYVGRTSVLGNPYTVQGHNRDKAIELFSSEIKNCLYNKVDTEHFRYKIIVEILTNIHKALTVSDIYLICHCKPKPCHGDVLKDIIEHYDW